jgi:glycosyltransferase involved in cell wall biosynthesis
VRVALIHDWLTGLRGGERVLDELAGLFPSADLFTLVHVPGSTTPRIDALRIHTSPLQRWSGSARHYRELLPLLPWAVRQLRIDGYDLVISVHHAMAKAARIAPGTPHLCYCLTPMRYAWDAADVYLGRGLRRALAAPLLAGLRRFDRATAGPEQVTRLVAISEYVRERTRRHWGRDAQLVYPPVDIDTFRPDGRPPDDFYLLVGAFVPYKRADLAIETFASLGRRLVVVGDGPLRGALERRALPGIDVLGRVSEPELAKLYARCRALVYPQEEDFGIAALEAQASGRPVIAFGRGGALETVRPLAGPPDTAAHATGVFFATQRQEALVEAVRRFEAAEPFFDAKLIRSHAERFSAARFRDEFMREVQATLGERVLDAGTGGG